MKSLIIILAFLFSQSIQAQTNISPVIHTNWFMAAREFREVDGQLYNTRLSNLWQFKGGEIMAVLDNEIVVQEFQEVAAEHGANEYGQRIVTATDKIYGLKFIIKNPQEKNPAVGELAVDRVMKIGTENYHGETLELWDCGKPHIFMVVTTNYPARLPQIKN
jgi:hypothetical protein